MLQATRGRGSNLTFVIGHIRTHIRILTRMQQPGLQVVSAGELARHSSVDSLWVAVHGLVYDLTGFIDEVSKECKTSREATVLPSHSILAGRTS